MKRIIGCLVVGITVSVHAQEFTSAPAKLARDNYLNALSQADKTYRAALQSALRQAESSKDSGEADRIKEALADIAEEETLNSLAPGQVSRLSFKTVTVTGGDISGYEIGKVAKGDKVVVKYVNGMFSAHKAKYDIPPMSPDQSDKIKCSIVTKMGEGYEELATIPTGTKQKPFEYTFTSAFQSVALTVPRVAKGEVTYKIAVIRTK